MLLYNNLISSWIIHLKRSFCLWHFNLHGVMICEQWTYIEFIGRINVGKHFLCSVLFCSKFSYCRKLILRTFYVQWDIQTIGNLKTIVDHCPQNFENHRKTIETNGWALKKHSMVMVQHVKTIEKPLKSMVAWKKTLTIPSLWKIDHRCGLVNSFPLINTL